MSISFRTIKVGLVIAATVGLTLLGLAEALAQRFTRPGFPSFPRSPFLIAGPDRLPGQIITPSLNGIFPPPYQLVPGTGTWMLTMPPATWTATVTAMGGIGGAGGIGGGGGIGGIQGGVGGIQGGIGGGIGGIGGGGIGGIGGGIGGIGGGIGGIGGGIGGKIGFNGGNGVD